MGLSRALRNVKAIPPPMRIALVFSRRCSITPILSETFAPPRMSTNGCFGSPLTADSISTSLWRRAPEKDGSTLIIALVDASALCDALNASITKTSKGEASCFANSTSFSCSSR